MRIILYLFVLIVVIIGCPTVSLAYTNTQPNEIVTQYMLDLSRDIQRAIKEPERYVLEDSRGELKLRLFLSPWGELKDVDLSESSGNTRLDRLCLKAVWMYERYQPFPQELGDENRWIDIPIVFETRGTDKFETSVRDEWFIPESKDTYSVIPGLEEAVDIASENNMTAKIAEDEISLSNLKIREARRALYPAASLNYLETVGRTTGTTQDFTDTEYKVKFEYPLYYGWRLKYAVDQAVSNMKASMYNYDEALQNLKAEVEAAFYAYIVSRVNLRLQRSLWKDTEKIFDIAKKRYDLELSTKAEFLQVQSQIKQVNYQISTSENDMTLARLTLCQAMNVNTEDVDSLLAIDIDVDLEPLDIEVGLEECMDLALIYRPDMKAKEYMIEFNDYGRKIAWSKDQLKVDLTGTYGKSGGAYESESLNLGNDWYLGFKVTKPLGGNTLSSAYTKDETSEKHGQSTRTESVSRSVELGLLDNLQSFSEKKSAEIALKKAREELKKTKDTVFKEVKESYLSFKKALIQIGSSLNKIKYKEEELKIAKARTELNEMPYSELIQAYIGLTDEKLFYIEALGNLYQSLTKLNKATGYSLFLDKRSITLADVR